MIAAAMREDTSVVSVMHANNEIGVVNDIAGIGEVCGERGVIYHVDAAQSTGKLPLDMEAMKVDLLSISAEIERRSTFIASISSGNLPVL